MVSSSTGMVAAPGGARILAGGAMILVAACLPFFLSEVHWSWTWWIATSRKDASIHIALWMLAFSGISLALVPLATRGVLRNRRAWLLAYAATLAAGGLADFFLLAMLDVHSNVQVYLAIVLGVGICDLLVRWPGSRTVLFLYVACVDLMLAMILAVWIIDPYARGRWFVDALGRHRELMAPIAALLAIAAVLLAQRPLAAWTREPGKPAPDRDRGKSLFLARALIHTTWILGLVAYVAEEGLKFSLVRMDMLLFAWWRLLGEAVDIDLRLVLPSGVILGAACLGLSLAAAMTRLIPGRAVAGIACAGLAVTGASLVIDDWLLSVPWETGRQQLAQLALAALLWTTCLLVIARWWRRRPWASLSTAPSPPAPPPPPSPRSSA